MSSENAILRYLQRELAPIVAKAIADSGCIWDVATLVAMAYRETGIFFAKYMDSHDLNAISALSRGDYSRRSGENEPQYHGFGLWQIDIDSFPEFVKSGDWKDTYKCCRKAIDVLNGKKKYLEKKSSLMDGALLRASIAAYNCGEGNVVKSLKEGSDVDKRTAHGNYSAAVLGYADLYKKLF
jgi:hypothetical protein